MYCSTGHILGLLAATVTDHGRFLLIPESSGTIASPFGIACACSQSQRCYANRLYYVVYVFILPLQVIFTRFSRLVQHTRNYTIKSSKAQPTFNIFTGLIPRRCHTVMQMRNHFKITLVAVIEWFWWRSTL